MFPTREEVLGAQEADAEPEDGQFVQAGDDVLGEGQQAGQAVQLRVQAVPVPFGRVGLGTFSWGWFGSGQNKQCYLTLFSYIERMIFPSGWSQIRCTSLNPNVSKEISIMRQNNEEMTLKGCPRHPEYFHLMTI